jgi:hypothetical protein
MTGVRPGPSSREGLTWLARVGPCPLGAWGIAMGWGQAAVYSHARRLRERGLLETCTRPRGEGSLVYASRRGVRESGARAAVMKRRPTPVTWSHWEACAWTAAWLTARGREMIAPREILVDDGWSHALRFRERGELRLRTHRPDLAGCLPDGRVLPIEVELSEKSSARLKAVLGLHAHWIASGRSAAVVYVCGTETTATRVAIEGPTAGLSVERGTMRVEALASIKRQAVSACSHLTSTDWHLARNEAA